MSKTSRTERELRALFTRIGLWNCFSALFLALLLWGLGLLLQKPQQGAGIAIGLVIISVCSLLSWFFDMLIQRFIVRLQAFAYPLGFLLKLVFLIITLPFIRRWGYPDERFLLLGFVLGVVLTLCISSRLVLRSRISDFDNYSVSIEEKM